jgi:hypothetical protein
MGTKNKNNKRRNIRTMHILFRKIQRTQTDPVFLPNNSDTGNGTGNRMDLIDKEEKKERHRVRSTPHCPFSPCETRLEFGLR